MSEPDVVQEHHDVKARQRKHWDAVAPGWAAQCDWIDQNFALLTEWLRTSGCWRPASRVLDVACGSGYPAIAAAKAIGPTGRVVATDISSGMLAVAAQRAHQEHIGNIEFVETDAEEQRFDSDSFDAVTMIYGLMLCPDPARALREMRRVLRPGGRAAIVVWDDPRNNPFFQVIFTGVVKCNQYLQFLFAHVRLQSKYKSILTYSSNRASLKQLRVSVLAEPDLSNC